MNPDITYDDIGSYPLPSDISRDWIAQAAASRQEDELLFRTIALSMQQKIEAGCVFLYFQTRIDTD